MSQPPHPHQSDQAALAAVFEETRPHLRAVAYRLLGSVDDADDAVQTAWLKASAADTAVVANLPGWLTTITARTCLDQLRARKRRGEVSEDDLARLREEVLLDTPEDEAVLVDEVGRAMLVVLDRLSPSQRVAYVLHDLFAVPFDEIAPLVERSVPAAKKLASRARERLHGPVEPARAINAEHLAVAEAFLGASRGGDLSDLLALLSPDVVRRIDPALVSDPSQVELRGARQIAEGAQSVAHRVAIAAVLLVDGEPAIAIAPHGRLQLLVRFTVAAGRIEVLEFVGDPRRLAELELSLAYP
ncbi:MAG TPA: sigma-70 family RNA polymerase sigma factor [Marmoricola sp.]|jgi:RNA polymerase sigma-70 factor (ECF subfamily)|nr:sigma-70 family RNA polymerase sigma factor [Marmoricola sp.]